MPTPLNPLKKALREPLLQFLGMGAGLFVLFGLINGPAEGPPNRIVVTNGQVERMVAGFTRTWMRPPNSREIDDLVDAYLRDEVYYREAIALGLDKGDALVRRRMRQKLEFILEDVSALLDPSEEELAAFLRANVQPFRVQPQVSFRQVYLSQDERPDVRPDAAGLLIRLRAGENPDDLGDQIMVAEAFELASRSEIERHFGEAFAREVSELPTGVWSGPLLSGLGAHLVLISEREDGRLPELAEIREEVKRDWLLERGKELKESTFRKLLEDYDVVIDQPARSPRSNEQLAATPPKAAQ